MVRKTIKAILKKKINQWVESIEDEKVRDLVLKNTIVTGGSIVSLLLNEIPKDYDIYFRNKETVLAVVKYYADIFNKKQEDLKKGNYVHIIEGGLDYTDIETNKQFNMPLSKYKVLEKDRILIWIRSSGIAEVKDEENQNFEDVYDTEIVGENSTQQEYLKGTEILDDISEKDLEKLDESEKPKRFRPLFFSANAITLSDKIQIVARFYGEAEEIHTSFDFIHATCYWQSWNNKLELPAIALESILNKQLIYQGSKYPVCSVMRLRKFLNRGYSVNAGQILKMLFQISELDLTDLNVLEDQLIGVDSSYFLHLIEILKSKQEEDKEFILNSSYIGSILDKIFG